MDWVMGADTWVKSAVKVLGGNGEQGHGQPMPTAVVGMSSCLRITPTVIGSWVLDELQPPDVRGEYRSKRQPQVIGFAKAGNRRTAATGQTA